MIIDDIIKLFGKDNFYMVENLAEYFNLSIEEAIQIFDYGVQVGVFIEVITEKEYALKQYYEEKDAKDFCDFVDKNFVLSNIKPIQLNLEETKLRDDVLQDIASRLLRNASEKLVRAIEKKHFIYTTRDDEKAEVWIYNEGIYIPEGRTFIREFCRKILGKSFNGHIANEVITKIEVDTYISQDKFFLNNDINIVAVKNGLLDINKNKLNPFNPIKIFFNKIPVEFDESKDCPNIKKHFNLVLKNPKEDVKIMQELFGFLLLKEYKIEKAFMFSGSGRNGKGKTLELMKRFLGIENCVDIPLQQFENDQWALGELFNKMANLGGDINKKSLNDTGAFKNLTGRDLISASRKFKTRINFTNYAKLIFCSNTLPETKDTSEAFWNRWVLLDFPYYFGSEKEIEEKEKEGLLCKVADPDIIEKLSRNEELSGLLNWALVGLKRLLDQKDFSYSKTSGDVKDIWLQKSDSFRAFLKECVVENYDKNISKIVLRKVYNEYCKSKRLIPSGDKKIKEVLLEDYGVSEYRDQSLGRQIACWRGVAFEISKVSEGSNGVYAYRGISNSPKGKNTLTTLTTPTFNDLNKNNEND